MWGRARQTIKAAKVEIPEPESLKQAVRQTRIELAEHAGVVVDLRDAELARLELLNEALNPLFAEIPPGVDLFDRGISRGDTVRLWVDAIAHVVMARDKRRYRFVQDTRVGRRVLAESTDIPVIVQAVTHYVAARIIERERALAGDAAPLDVGIHETPPPRRRRGRPMLMFLLGLMVGAVALFAALWIAASRLPH
jgi:hypothetical protein